MAAEEIHTINGRLDGKFYTLPAGMIYLAHRNKRDIYRDRHAWCLHESTLRRCQELRVTAVGVLWKNRQTRLVHLSHIEDFYGPDSFFVFKGARQRGLPLKCFRIDTSNEETNLGKLIRLR